MRTPPDPTKFAGQWDRGETFAKPHREKRAEVLREMVGRHFDPSDSTQRPINVVRNTVELLVPQIVDDTPKVRVTTRRVRHRAEADLLAVSLEHLADEIELAETLEEAIVDALLSPMGVVFTGLKAGGDILDVEGASFDNGQPFAVVVDYDDYCCDPTARHPRQVGWEGHRFTVAREAAVEGRVYGKDPEEYQPGEEPYASVATRDEAAEIIGGLGVRRSGDEGRDQGGVEDLPGERKPEDFEFEEKIELLHIAFYAHDCTYIGVIPADKGSREKWLRWEKHDGPEKGPYHKLWFQHVPKSPIPLAPVTGWLDLHEAIRKVVNKTVKQMLKQKRVFPYTRGTGQDDSRTIKQASDGEFVPVDDSKNVGQFDIGGVAGENYEALGFLNEAANRETGNTQLLAGLDASDTATESQNKQANMNARIRRFVNRTTRFAQRIMRTLGWYIHTDPLFQHPVARRIPGGEWVQLVYDAAAREADFFDLTFTIERYSMGGNMDPAVRARRVVEYLGVLGNLMPLIMAGVVSQQGVLRVGREEFGIDSIDDLIPDPALQAATEGVYAGAGPPALGQMPGQPPGQPQHPGGAPAPGRNGTASGLSIHQRQSAVAPRAPY